MRKNASIGERMKDYENAFRFYLTKRTPVIIRIDGKAFHSFTKGFDKPFDPILTDTMEETSKFLCETITGCKLAYTQSDEISLLLTDYDTIGTRPWFENNLQKLVSVSASTATLAFNRIFADKCTLFFDSRKSESKPLSAYAAALSKALKKGATFDSRAFILPKEEVVNYFIWRQQDATRNSILSVAQSLFSHDEILGIKCDALQDKIFKERNINWNDYPVPQKRGVCIIKRPVLQNTAERIKWTIDKEIPIFTKDRAYIENLVYGTTSK